MKTELEKTFLVFQATTKARPKPTNKRIIKKIVKSQQSPSTKPVMMSLDDLPSNVVPFKDSKPESIQTNKIVETNAKQTFKSGLNIKLLSSIKTDEIKSEIKKSLLESFSKEPKTADKNSLEEVSAQISPGMKVNVSHQ